MDPVVRAAAEAAAAEVARVAAEEAAQEAEEAAQKAEKEAKEAARRKAMAEEMEERTEWQEEKDRRKRKEEEKEKKAAAKLERARARAEAAALETMKVTRPKEIARRAAEKDAADKWVRAREAAKTAQQAANALQSLETQAQKLAAEAEEEKDAARTKVAKAWVGVADADAKRMEAATNATTGAEDAAAAQAELEGLARQAAEELVAYEQAAAAEEDAIVAGGDTIQVAVTPEGGLDAPIDSDEKENEEENAPTDDERFVNSLTHAEWSNAGKNQADCPWRVCPGEMTSCPEYSKMPNLTMPCYVELRRVFLEQEVEQQAKWVKWEKREAEEAERVHEKKLVIMRIRAEKEVALGALEQAWQLRRTQLLEEFNVRRTSPPTRTAITSVLPCCAYPPCCAGEARGGKAQGHGQ